jgi:hypothetical protein
MSGFLKGKGHVSFENYVVHAFNLGQVLENSLFDGPQILFLLFSQFK